jgi:hypothetical protein
VRHGILTVEFSDELQCPEGQFKCDEMTCIAIGKVCDGTLDCESGADEHLCSECSHLINCLFSFVFS